MIIAINKPKGPSSFQMIGQIRKITGIRKIGHAGTLDPLASGVLVVAIGRESTRQISQIVEKEKEYVAKIKFGLTSSTDDEAGEKKIISARKPRLEEIEKIIPKFLGNIKQVPPQFSAIKIKGNRAYQMARAGQIVKFRERFVEIKNIEILNYKYPYLNIKVTTGPGAYIRSLARDIGQKLKVGAYMAELQRTRVGDYKIEDCLPLSKIKESMKNFNLIKSISAGDIGVMSTDTIYGLMGLALNKKVVQRIYKVRKRSPEKPFIILISSIEDLGLFGIKINAEEKAVLEKFWPGKISIILPCKSSKWQYLHRGTKGLAFRLPKKPSLINILKQTGPLISTSANPEGEVPAKTIAEAKKYFGHEVDFYVSGKSNSEPSTLAQLQSNGELVVLRQGAVKIN
ncbi:MAG: tRNA pseudouridine(55) synthase TruB [Patescibacteria group bacterium]|jgi:tRNA pseudouridine55 synthase